MMDYNGQLRRGYYKGVTAFPVQAGFFWCQAENSWSSRCLEYFWGCYASVWGEICPEIAGAPLFLEFQVVQQLYGGGYLFGVLFGNSRCPPRLAYFLSQEGSSQG
jgi:hypothetical protein